MCKDTYLCDGNLRHLTATLIYRQNEGLLSHRSDLIAWSRTRDFGEPPAEHQWRRTRGQSAEPASSGPGRPGVGADGQYACTLVEGVTH